MLLVGRQLIRFEQAAVVLAVVIILLAIAEAESIT